MKLMTTGEGKMVRLWADALSGVVIRHPNPGARPCVQLDGGETEASLTLMVYDAIDTATDGPHPRNPLLISHVRLTFFPGGHMARLWLAAAWAGLLQHEALELVTNLGSIVLNPHDEPYLHCPWNRGLRDGLPVELTPHTLRKALAVVMDQDAANMVASLGAVH